ncbi:MAG TPA: helix-turn-helix transcriptional regulator [Mucilaginibacter sp.]
MLLLWIVAGLTVVGLLILNIVLLKRSRADRRSRELKEILDKELLFSQKCADYRLSAREVEVLRLILAGHTYRSAGDILFISENTVDAHLRSIYSKTGVRNKVELVRKFYS